MKKMDYNGIMLCKIQANLFKNYREYSSCSPYFFIRRFMNSHLSERFDDMTILLEASSDETFINEIDEQYGMTFFGKADSISPEVMYWVGYVYRYWSYIYEVPSHLLFKQVQPKLLFDRYALYHSMDVEYAIERICEEETILISPNKTLQEIIDEFIKDNQ